MREVAFIKQNKEKWLEIEQLIHGKLHKNPDELSFMYINLINDLSFSQTYYPNSNTTVYLNQLSGQIFHRIYKTKRIEQNRFSKFFKTEVPQLMYHYRRYLLYSTLFFFFFVLIGAISARYDHEFVKLVLGEDYVNMTLENIEKGNAVAVYGKNSNWGTATVIIFNNLKVSASLYLYGVFGGVGTLISLLYNGIMVGSFQYFFYEQGVLEDSVRGIWMHGAFEIFSIVIVGMAGLVLGTSVLFPKSYSRFDSFKKGFRDSFKIFLSTLPFIILAGIIEGFITRYALQLPKFINWLTIFVSLGIIVYYYAIYPQKFKKNDRIL